MSDVALQEAGSPFLIEGELTIYRATELKPLILQVVARGAGLGLDLSAVDEIDTAGVQLLLLARREAGERGEDLRLLHASPVVREVFGLLGLGEHLQPA